MHNWFQVKHNKAGHCRASYMASGQSVRTITNVHHYIELLGLSLNPTHRSISSIVNSWFCTVHLPYSTRFVSFTHQTKQTVKNGPNFDMTAEAALVSVGVPNVHHTKLIHLVDCIQNPNFTGLKIPRLVVFVFSICQYGDTSCSYDQNASVVLMLLIRV